ncbi:MAG: oxidoreductase [Actinomycetota bacterium]
MLGEPLELRCGLTLANRLVKAAMSDALGDGRGGVTDAQCSLYRRWAAGGTALSIIGEVQTDRQFPESPGNLVVDDHADREGLARLAAAGQPGGVHLWPQLGHAGALAHASISNRAGPSALDLPELSCRALTIEEIEALPGRFASSAARCAAAGFTGVEVHAGHGFLLSQFLSPLFNRRTDRFGGSIEARASIIIAIVEAIRTACGREFGVGIKLNCTDQLEGGLTEDEALIVVEMLDETTIDVIDLSGGTYFPGAASTSDRTTEGPYFADVGRRARGRTSAAVMVTGGVKTRADAAGLIDSGAADLVGLARTMALDPELPASWLSPEPVDPSFPSFSSTIPGGITAWYTQRLAELAGIELAPALTPEDALAWLEARMADREGIWRSASS